MELDIISDARFVAAAKVRQARAMTPEMKFRAGADLFEEACVWTLAGIARQFPSASAEERQEILRKRLDQQRKNELAISSIS